MTRPVLLLLSLILLSLLVGEIQVRRYLFKKKSVTIELLTFKIKITG